jgi:hypothetical protein
LDEDDLDEDGFVAVFVVARAVLGVLGGFDGAFAADADAGRRSTLAASSAKRIRSSDVSADCSSTRASSRAMIVALSLPSAFSLSFSAIPGIDRAAERPPERGFPSATSLTRAYSFSPVG